MSDETTRLRVTVGIATAGRPDLLAETVRLLERQTRRPDRIVICAPSADDAGTVNEIAGVETYFGVRGLPKQRNVILDRADDCNVVLFIDDDFIAADDYVELLERLHLTHPSVLMFTGDVLRDGVTTGGLTIPEAFEAIRAAPVPSDPSLTTAYNGYGCNMSILRDVVMREHIRFDENLPLYGWLEDVDFSRSLARFGSIMRADALRGVHLGVKAGRQRGLRLGYSQIANPIYIRRKGNLSLRRALAQIGRNITANLVRSLRPEPHIDRRGRVFGNLLALADLVRGRISPDRVLGL